MRKRRVWLITAVVAIVVLVVGIVAVARTVPGDGALSGKGSATALLENPFQSLAQAARDRFGGVQSAAEGQSSEAAVPSGGKASLATAADTLVWSAVLDGRLFIREGALSMTVRDVTRAVDEVSDVVGSIAGAFVSASNLRQDGKRTVATVTVKVPSDSFDRAMRQLRQIAAEVASENVTSQEVTEEYVDLSSQLRNLKATEAQYLTLLSRADKITDILAIQDRLSGVRANIERTQGRMNFLDQRSELSTIRLTMVPVVPEVEKEKPAWDAAKAFQAAFRNLLLAFGWLLDGAIYAAVYSVPLLPFVFVFVLWRRRRAPATNGTGTE